MENIFLDRKNQAFFEKNGYVKLKILSDKAVDYLSKIYLKYEKEHLKISTRFHSTSDTSNKSLIQNVNLEVKEILLSETSGLFHPIKSLIANFMIKEPGKNSEVAAHQDWTFVNEEKGFSGNLWAGLQDINHQNGCMFFLPGSHNITKSLRVSPSYKAFYESLRFEIPKYAKYEPTKKGEGFLINHAVVHGSGLNLSLKSRKAVLLGVSSKSEQLLHYYKPEKEKDLIEKYHIEPNDIINLKKDQRPENLSPISKFNYEFKELDVKLIKNKLFSNKQFIINKLKGFS